MVPAVAIRSGLRGHGQNGPDHLPPHSGLRHEPGESAVFLFGARTPKGAQYFWLIAKVRVQCLPEAHIA